MIDTADLEALAEKLPSLDTGTQALLWGALTADVLTRCATDGLFWLRFVQTRDEADADTPVKPFPVHKAYTQDLWKVYERDRRIAVAKSRQMIVSWETCAFACWTARFHPHRAVYWQTKAWPDAVKMTAMPQGGVTGRCQFIEEHLPSWMRQECKYSEGRIQYPNGAIIQALSGGADQVRSVTGSLFIEDEFAFQDEQDGVYTALAPLIQKGAKAIFISSPNGSSNTFATLFHGRPVGEEGIQHG